MTMIQEKFALGGGASADPLLALIAAYDADPRPQKIDVGIGVYRNDLGETPVFRAVKQAERHLLEQQKSKSYLGAAGDMVFVELLKPIIFGEALADWPGLTGVQTPGGTGALRLAAELIAMGRGGSTVWLSDPTWPVHATVFHAAGLKTARYSYFDFKQQSITFDAMMSALGKAASGDTVVLHGCCHNPTGADLSPAQWGKVIEICRKRGLLAFIDLAYQALGEGSEMDGLGVRAACARLEHVIVAYSCDKNFGLYRDRVGALFVKAPQLTEARQILTNILSLARGLWSMPPDHGAAVVRTILQSSNMKADWLMELEQMRARIHSLRTKIAAKDRRLSPIGRQQGLFSTFNLGPVSVGALARDHAIYMASPGRINIAGLRPEQVDRFGEALLAYL